jgi:hypothetical protein
MYKTRQAVAVSAVSTAEPNVDVAVGVGVDVHSESHDYLAKRPNARYAPRGSETHRKGFEDFVPLPVGIILPAGRL